MKATLKPYGLLLESEDDEDHGRILVSLPDLGDRIQVVVHQDLVRDWAGNTIGTTPGRYPVTMTLELDISQFVYASDELPKGLQLSLEYQRE